MTVLRSYRVLRFALVLTAILAQCVALSSVSLLVITGTLASLSWYVTEGPRGRSIPPWVARLLVLVVVLFSAADAFGPVALLPLVLGRFVIWLTVIKLYGSRTIDNEAQLLLLSLLLMAVGGLYATDFLFGVLFILWSGLAAWVLLLYQLHHGVVLMRMERHKAVPLEHPAPWTRPVTGLHAQRAFRQTAIVLLLFGALSSIAFFVVMPRDATMSVPRVHLSHNDGSGRLELKPDREIVQSDRQVLSVALWDSSGNAVQLPQGLRLRGNVLDSYRGNGVWETGSHIQSSIDVGSREMTPLTMEGDGQAVLTMEVTLRQQINRVYSLYRPLGIETDRPTRLVMNLANGTMGLGLGARPFTKYRVAIDLEPVITSPIMPRRHVYQSEKVKELALQVLHNVAIDLADINNSPDVIARVARTFETYLRSNIFTYSVDGSTLTLAQKMKLEEDNDPIATFLLTHKRGHCEYFAASMVAMCNSVGIPARIVTGFYADRWDAVSKSYMVLERDAHAWVEVETEQLAWTPFDPTPLSEGAPIWQQSLSFAQSIRFAWQRWEMKWQANVVGFDSLAQTKILKAIDPYWRNHFNTIRDAVKHSVHQIIGWFDIGSGGRLWIDLVGGAIGLSSFTVLIVIWRKRRTKKLLRLSSDLDEHLPVVHVEFYARLQRVLARHGWIRPTFVPTLTWINSLPLDKETEAAAVQLTEMYYAIRYGNHRPARVQRLELMQTVRQVDTLLRKEIDE